MSGDTPKEAEERHHLFIAGAISNGVVWGLENGEGWANWSSEGGEKVIPFWTEEDKALECAEETFPGYSPKPVDLEDLVKGFLPALSDAGVWVGTNLTSDMSGIDIPADELATKLRGAGVA